MDECSKEIKKEVFDFIINRIEENNESIYDKVALDISSQGPDTLSKLIKAGKNEVADIITFFDFYLLKGSMRSEILNWALNSKARHIVLSGLYSNKTKSTIDKFIYSMGYWWALATVIRDKNDVCMFVFEKKKRPIEDIENYKNLKNYYYSEQLNAGAYMIHEIETIELMKAACKDVELVVELGTFHGGLTLQLSDNFPDAEIHSFDIVVLEGVEEILKNIGNRKTNITFYQENILDKKSSTLVDLLKSDKKKFLYCDNGRKIKELNCYAPYLNEGDILGTHDWNVEISKEHISKTLINFKPVLHKEAKELELLTRMWERE